MRRVRHRWLIGALLLLTASAAPAESDDSHAKLHSSDERTNPTAVEGPPERIIYIPFDELSDVFENPAAAVFLPYSEYVRLRDKGASSATEGSAPDGVITRATYRATIDEDIAHIHAELNINVIRKPWAELPLRFGDAAVGEFSAKDENTVLRGTGNGTYTLLVRESGEQTVALELTARVIKTPDGRQIDLDCPPAAITNFEIIVPQAEQQIEVRPRLTQQKLEAGADETRVRASLGATDHIAAAWRPRATSQPQMQLLTSVDNLQRYHLGNGLIHADASLTFEVLRGQLQQVRVVVPPGHRILDVSASTKVQSWHAEESNEGQVVTVELLNPIDNQVTVELHTEMKMSDAAIRIGGREDGRPATGIHALGVARESGQIVLSNSSDVSIQVIEQSSVSRIAPDEVEQGIQQPGAIAFKYYTPGITLAVLVSEVEPRVVVSNATDIVIIDDSFRINTDLSYSIERAGVFDVKLAIPEGLVIDDVRSDSLQEYRLNDNTLLAVLRERTLGEFRLTIEGHLRIDQNEDALILPIPEPDDVDRETGIVRLFADDAIDLTTDEERLDGARPAPIPSNVQRDSSHLRAAWQFTRRPALIPVKLTHKPTRLSAQVATDVSAESTRTRVTTLVDFNVEYAALDRFRVLIPEEALKTLQIEAVSLSPTSPSIKEQLPGVAENGWIPYTLAMQRGALGKQRFRIVYDIEPSEVLTAIDDGQEPDSNEANKTERNPDAIGTDKNPEGGATKESPGGNDNVPENRTDNPVSENEGAARSAESLSENPKGEESGNAEPSANNSARQAVPVPEEASEAATPEGTGERGPLRMQSVVRLIRPQGVESQADGVSTSLSQVTGEVCVRKDQALTISAEATGADIEPIDTRQLTTITEHGTFAFRYRKHPPDESIVVRVQQMEYGVQELIETVISRALVEVVLGEDLTATYRCRYQIKSTERQRLRVDLPKGMEILSVLVDGSEVRLEPDPVRIAGDLWDTFYVKVARERASADAFALTLQFLWTIHPKPFHRGFQGTIQLPLPRIGERAASAVQQTRLVLWIPTEYALIGSPEGFTLLGTSSLQNALRGRPTLSLVGESDQQWIAGEDQVLLEFPTTGRKLYRYSHLGGDLELNSAVTLLWWNTLWYTIVASVALAIIGWLLLRTSWENKLGFLLLLGFVAVLLGLKNEHLLAHAVSAARFGLAFLLALWLLGAIFSRRVQFDRSATATSNESQTMPPAVAVVPPPGVFEQHQTEGLRDDDHR